MNSFQTRKAFLDFFVSHGHNIVEPSSLIPSDPSVLFTTAGMQQFKPYFLNQESPYGNMVTTCQKCIRTSDIENIGDETHLTFFEMLGNFSFGGYFKKETINYAYQFLTDTLKLPKEKIWITYFKGDEKVEKDNESVNIWKELGIGEDRMVGFDREDNFWGPTGFEGPCGPTTEIHYDLTGKPCSLGDKCLPNCECKRFIEIWNLVFNTYFSDKFHNLTPLPRKGIDTGMGLERLCIALQGKTNLFETDLFDGIIKAISKESRKDYAGFQESFRIIADHLKTAIFLIEEGIVPGKNDREYILRRILRRAIRHAKKIGLKEFNIVLEEIFSLYQLIYPNILKSKPMIISVINEEKEKFEKTLEKGLKEFEKLSSITGEKAFYLYETYGFPVELTQELAKEKNLTLDLKEFEDYQRKHQDISRAGAEKKFGGVGIDMIDNEEDKEKVKRLHTATHLLHQALRKVLGTEVKQMGSDINPDRLRFDFSFPRKLEKEELDRAEGLINEQIKQGLEVKKEEMFFEEAVKAGALAFFKEKYPERVNVYSIGDFSKEVCAGPHVDNVSELKCVKILKEEAVGAGIRRIKAKLN